MKKQGIFYQVTKLVIQKAIQREAEDWPPITLCGMYQPHRPEKKQCKTSFKHDISCKS